MNPRLRKGRVQTQGFDAVQSIQPAGLPGSTYERPAEAYKPGRDLALLAEAFGGLSSSLSNLHQDRLRQERAAAAEAKADAREARRDQREADTAARETARDAAANAKAIDEQNKQVANQMPWETFTPAQLDQVITENDTPGGNPFALQMAATVKGKKAGVDFSAELTQAYTEEYDPSSGQTVRQFLEGKANEWLNSTWNDMGSTQQRLARQGAWSVIDTHIKELESKDKSFVSDQNKADYTQGLDAEASNIIVDGKQKNVAPKNIAAEFLTSWATFRKASTGDRAHPEFMGVDVNTPFKKAVEGAAANGDVDLVMEMLNTQVPGMRASLLKDPEHQKWAEETKTAAIKASITKTQDNAYATLANMEYLAGKGELNDEIIKGAVDQKLLTPKQATDFMVKSRAAKDAAVAKAQAEAEKTKAELAHVTAVDQITAGNLETAITGAGLSGLQDREVPSKDGKGTTTLTVKDQQDAIISKWEKQNAAKVEEVRASQGDQAAAEYDMNSKMEFYGTNYQLENKQWKALFDSVGGGMSLRRWIASGGKDVPADVQMAFDTYDKLVDKDPTLAAQYVKDEKTRVILEAYHIAKTNASVYSGSGVATPEGAMGMALEVADRLENNPDKVKGIFWTEKSKGTLRKKIMDGGWIGFDGKVPDDLTGQATKLADFYSRAGMTEEAAIARAVEDIKKDYVQVHSGVISGGYLVNSKGISDKEGFVDFIDTVVPEKVHMARGGPFDGNADFIPVRVGDNWMLKEANGNAILMNDKGKPVIITPKDYDQFKERRLQEDLKEAQDKAQGKASAWEILWNGLTNAEDRNRFWAMKEKWDKQQEQQALWEKQRIDREGGVAPSETITGKAQFLLDKMGQQGRAKAVSGLDPKTYDTAQLDLSTLAPLPGQSYTTDTILPIMEMAESSGNPNAISPTGDHFGLMQLGVDTAAVDAAKALGMTEYVSADREHRIDMLMDPVINRKLGRQYMTMMMDKYQNNVEDALVAYNWGQGNADKWIAGGRKWADLPAETRGYVSKIMSQAGDSRSYDFRPGQYTTGQYGTKIAYSNQGAVRNHKVTPTLEAKLDYSVGKFFGPGYTVQIFSGGQPRKGTSNARTGSTRHDDHGHGGRAADVYIIGPDGRKVRDKVKLMRFKRQWIASGMGSVGSFMSDFGLHLDEITQDKLGPGQSLSWSY